MDRSEVVARINAIIFTANPHLSVETLPVDVPLKQLLADKTIRSLELLETLMAIEEELKIAMPEDDDVLFDTIITINNLYDFVLERVNLIS